jgi:hypothetical protein
VPSSSNSCNLCPKTVASPSTTSERHRTQRSCAQKRQGVSSTTASPSAETSPRRLPPHANPRWRPTQRFLGVANLPQLAARRRRRSPSTARLCPEPSRRPSLTVRRHGSALPSTAEAPHEHRNAAKNKPTQPKTTIPTDDQRF